MGAAASAHRGSAEGQRTGIPRGTHRSSPGPRGGAPSSLVATPRPAAHRDLDTMGSSQESGSRCLHPSRLPPWRGGPVESPRHLRPAARPPPPMAPIGRSLAPPDIDGDRGIGESRPVLALEGRSAGDGPHGVLPCAAHPYPPNVAFRLGQRSLKTHAIGLQVVLPQRYSDLGELSVGAAGLVEEDPTSVIVISQPFGCLTRQSARLP